MFTFSLVVLLSLSLGCTKDLGELCDDASECGGEGFFCVSPDGYNAKVCVSECPCPDNFACDASTFCVRECVTDEDCLADGTACNQSKNPNFLGRCAATCTDESSCNHGNQGACIQSLEDTQKFCD